MDTTSRSWHALSGALTMLVLAAGLALVTPPSFASARPAASPEEALVSGTDDAGLGPFGSLTSDPMNGYRLFEVPTDSLMTEYYSIDALGPNGEIVGRSAEGDNGNHLTPFVFVPGEGTQWLEAVPWSLNRIGGFDAQGNIYGTAADGTHEVDEVVVWKWTRTKSGYTAPEAIFHGDSIKSDWQGSITAVNAAGDVLLEGNPGQLLRGGSTTPLDGPDGSFSYAHLQDLNDKGIAVGASVLGTAQSAWYQPTRWGGGDGPASLGYPPQVFENAYARVINNEGQVVVDNPDRDRDPWLRQVDGRFQLFQVPEGAPNTSVQQVDDLDDHGTAVGFYQPDGRAAALPAYAAIWTENGQRVQVLDELLPGGSTWRLERAFAINERGMIAGVGVHAGKKVAWIAVPIDPVVFVHGAGASSLYSMDGAGQPDDELWMDCTVDREELSLWPEDIRNGEAPARSGAVDALRHETCLNIGEWYDPALDIYGSFLDRLRGQYQEYDRDETPARQTEAGCDTSQKGTKTPNLFVYAYDWRRDNDDNAKGLAEYVKCVHKFWPDSKVDIVTHSMGSLVARRYLLQEGGDDVDRMITLGAPWLGAPKLVDVLQTGNFAPQPVNGSRAAIKHVVGSFPAAHQLAASRLYADAARLPIMMEQGWDINGRGGAWESYAYDDVKALLDAQNPTFKPGTTGDAFQQKSGAVGGQTDWRNDTSGVAYTHVVGLQAGADTIGSVVATRTLVCSGSGGSKTCEPLDHIRQVLVCGDGTVPYISAERAGKGIDYNAPDAEILLVHSDDPDANHGAEHTGMAANSHVQDRILERLFSPMVDEDDDGHRDPVEHDRSGLGQPGDDLDSCYQPAEGEGAGLAATKYGANNPAPGTGRRYVSVVAGESLVVTDSQGHTTDPEDGSYGYVKGVTLFPSDRPDAGMATFPESDTVGYTSSFTGTGKPVQVELLEGSQTSPTRALRWTDVPVEDGQAVSLRAAADGAIVLKVDRDGDGTPETAVPPTVKVGGADAADTTPPVVSATRLNTSEGARFALSATDEGSGVAALMWSADGTHFERYTEPVVAEPGAQLTAFATDRAGNRSAAYEFAADEVEAGLFTAASIDPQPSDGGWTAGTAKVTLTAQAPAGAEVASITYRTAGAAGDHERTVTGDTAELEVSATGITTVTYAATATDGASEPERSTLVRIDQAPPTVSVKRPTPVAVVTDLPTIRGTASDDASGVTGIEVELRNGAGQSWDGEAWSAEPSWLGTSGTTTWSRSTGLPTGGDLPDGAYRLRVRATDGAGRSVVSAAGGFTVAPTAAVTVRRLSVDGGSRTSAVALNDQGVATGLFVRGSQILPARWGNGRVEELPLAGSATDAAVRAVDDLGAAYGSQNDSAQLWQPVRWETGHAGVSVLPTLAETGAGEVAATTSDGSVQVGWSSRGPLDPHLPVRWVDGSVEPLPLTSGATDGEATGVADDGTAVGTLTTPAGRRAVLWPADGGVRNLGTLANHRASAAVAINDLGLVVGTSTDANGWTDGFVYADEQMRRIEKSVSTRGLQPRAVDNAGTVVGDYTPLAGGATRAFVTGTEGWAEDLADRLPAGSGWTLESARGVNELGQVVGFGIKDGRYDGYVIGAAHAPLTQDQAVATPKDTAVSIDLTGFDPDVADPVAYEVLDEPAHGALGPVENGRVTYTPDGGFEGTDRFSWRMSDPEYGSVPATVTVTVGSPEPDPEPDPDPDPEPEPDAPPTIAIAAPETGEEGSTVTLHATAVDPEGVALEVAWSVSGGVISGTGTDVTLTLPDGPDTITVTAATSDGTHTATATTEITVHNVRPTAEAGNDVAVKRGVALTLTGVAGDVSAQDAAELTTSWDFGDGSQATGTTATHTWAQAGVYQVRFTVTDPDGATTTDVVTVTVGETRTPGSAIGVVGVKEGVATLAAYGDGKTARGTVTWLGKGGPFVAKVTDFDRVTTMSGKPAAWIDGTFGKHTIRVYAESGLWFGQGDVFRLWVDGKLVTATGKRTIGAVLIS